MEINKHKDNNNNNNNKSIEPSRKLLESVAMEEEKKIGDDASSIPNSRIVEEVDMVREEASCNDDCEEIPSSGGGNRSIQEEDWQRLKRRSNAVSRDGIQDDSDRISSHPHPGFSKRVGATTEVIHDYKSCGDNDETSSSDTCNHRTIQEQDWDVLKRPHRQRIRTETAASSATTTNGTRQSSSSTTVDQPIQRFECSGEVAIDDGDAHERSRSGIALRPGAYRIVGIANPDDTNMSSLDIMDCSVEVDDDDDCSAGNDNCRNGDEVVLHAELVAEDVVDSLWAENLSLKARLDQLESERDKILIVCATPTNTVPNNDSDSQRLTTTMHNSDSQYLQHQKQQQQDQKLQKMDITKASKLVCKVTNDIDKVFSLKSPKNSQAGLASGVKNMGKGVAAGVAGLLGEVIAGCSSGKGATRAATGVGKGVVKIAILPAAGAVVGISQIGRGFANSVCYYSGGGSGGGVTRDVEEAVAAKDLGLHSP